MFFKGIHEINSFSYNQDNNQLLTNSQIKNDYYSICSNIKIPLINRL